MGSQQSECSAYCCSQRQHMVQLTKNPAPGSYGEGLLLSLQDGICSMEFVDDTEAEHIHPNVRVPASCDALQELGGGGSGTTVISAFDSNLGRLVLKHAGPKDMAEVFALADVREELRMRAAATDSIVAASDMRERTPEFTYLYMSPVHLRNRAAERWRLTRASIDASDLIKSDGISAPHLRGTAGCQREIRINHHAGEVASERWPSEHVNIDGEHMNVFLGEAVDEEKSPQGKANVALSRPGRGLLLFNTPCRKRDVGNVRGYQYLREVIKDLISLQNEHCFKFTIAQGAVGGASTPNCSKLLASGSLHEERSKKLLDEFVRVIRALQSLTLPGEADIKDIQLELSALRASANPSAANISDALDAFVGGAIRKNFHPEKGRFKKLRHIGEQFRSRSFILEDAEILPARLLGELLKEGAQLEDVFATDLFGCTAFDQFFDVWPDLLKKALAFEVSAARDLVWTCGLTDSGLHNLKLDGDRLFLFDLGEPSLMPLPAFLTKFLMSFFHTLGMVDPGKGNWVNRFQLSDPCDRVELTAESVSLLKVARKAFNLALDRLVAEFFQGEPGVASLLIRYVILQLLSDAGFCISRWETKGGGQARWRSLALEKWLWRTLWDIYVASDVMTKLGVLEERSTKQDHCASN